MRFIPNQRNSYGLGDKQVFLGLIMGSIWSTGYLPYGEAIIWVKVGAWGHDLLLLPTLNKQASVVIIISTNALIIAFSITKFVREQSNTGKAPSFEKNHRNHS